MSVQDLETRPPAAFRPAARDAVTERGPSIASQPVPFVGLDVSASARASAAAQDEAGKWEGLIEAAANNFGLSREQRAAAVAALRQRQQAAANGARRGVMEEEQQKAKAYRRSLRQRRTGAAPSA